MKRGLYVVATPIGNLGDLSPRAAEVLAAVDLVAAEDTRHLRRLQQRLAAATPAISYNEHSEGRSLARIEACLDGGGSVALVSDAGTPLISDPGYRLVRLVQERGVDVFAVPGPCAAVAALSVSGLATDRFLFEGFLPSRDAARARRLEQLAGETATLVFYEAPHRLVDSLAAMLAAFGPEREAVLARELTKVFETVRRASLGDLLAWVRGDANQSRGEIVLLVAGRSDRAEITPEITALLRRLAEELPARRAAAVVADCTGLRARQLYDVLLSLKSR